MLPAKAKNPQNSHSPSGNEVQVCRNIDVNGLLLSDQGPGPGFFDFESEFKQPLLLAVCCGKLDADGQPVVAKT